MTISRGSEVKFRDGTGIVFTMYSFTASMLYFSCAEIGTIGEDSATVPCWVVNNWTTASKKGRTNLSRKQKSLSGVLGPGLP